MAVVNSRRGSIAGFKGKHNESKCKVLMVLWNLQHVQGNRRGLTSLEIHQSSGVSYEYLLTRLHIWACRKWNYLKRYPSIDDRGRLAWRYVLGHRGFKFISLAKGRGAPVDRYAQEIRDFRNHTLNAT